MSAIRAGYKHTEVGVIPVDWDVTTLLHVAKTSMQNGLFFKPELKGAGVKLINVGDLFSRYPIDTESLELFRATAKEVERFGVYSGDLFFTRSSIVPSGIAHCNTYVSRSSEPVVFDSHVIRFRPNAEIVHSSYLFRFCGASIARQYLVSNAKTGTMTTIDQGVLGKCPVLIPPKKEQEAIADALSDADALIESLEQLLAKKRHLKQGSMQELLTGKMRLPGFSGNWEILPIGAIADVKTGPFGSALHESDYVQSGTPIITVEHLGEFGVTRQNLPLVSDEDCRRLGAYSLKAGDIVFSRVGSVDRNALITEAESGWLFSGRLLRVRVDVTRVFAPYLSFQFHTQAFKQLVLTVAVGQTMASLNTKILNGILVTLPSLKEQNAIASILSEMDSEIAELESQLAKTRTLKQGMMQKLLTGEIRLI